MKNLNYDRELCSLAQEREIARVPRNKNTLHFFSAVLLGVFGMSNGSFAQGEAADPPSWASDQDYMDTLEEDFNEIIGKVPDAEGNHPG